MTQFSRSRVSKTGQITIPAKLRRTLRLRPGTLVTLREEHGSIVVTSVKRLLDQIQGFLRPRPGETSVFEMSLAERARERLREER